MDLPVDNEPLVLADGTKIDPTNGKVIKDRPPVNFIFVPSLSEAQNIVARARKSVAELPLPPAKLSGVALVAFYTLFGLTDRDIAIALDGKLTEEQVGNIRSLDAYKEFMRSAKENILHTESQTVRDIFDQHSLNAAIKVVQLSQDDNDVMALTASKDILDRAGHRPADVVEHRHKMDNALQIVITKRDENEQVPMIDVTPERITDEH